MQQAAAAADAGPVGAPGDLLEQSAGGSAAAGSDLPPNKRQRSGALVSAAQPDQAPSALFTAFPAAGTAVDRSEITVGTPLSGTVDAISDSSTYFVTLTLAGVDFKGEAGCWASRRGQGAGRVRLPLAPNCASGTMLH